MATPRIRIQVDWDDDDDFRDANSDISGDVLAWRSQRGRDYASALTGRSVAGQASVVVSNVSEKYSSRNSSGPLFGNLKPGRSMRITSEPPLENYGVFNGSTSKVTIPDVSAIQDAFDAGTLNGGTVEVLVYAKSDGELNAGIIIDKRSGGSGWALFVEAESAGFVKVSFFADFDSTDGKWRTVNAVLPLNEWHRIAVSYNNSSAGNDAIIQIDDTVYSVGLGNLQRTSTPVGTRVSDVGSDVTIGNNAGQAQTWDGFIDDVRMWDNRRTSSQISDEKFNELAGSESALVGYWRFNESSGSTIDDLAGNSDGTATAVSFENDHLWSGKLLRIAPRPSLTGRKLADIVAFGALGSLNQEQIQVEPGSNILTSDAIDDILDAASWPSADRDINTGKTTMPKWWIDRKATIDALRIIERTESGFIVETADGKIRFEDRHFRLISPRTTPQATFSDNTGAAIPYSNPEQADPLDFIFNKFTIDVPNFTTQGIATLWTLAESGSDSPTVAPGQSRTFNALFPNPQNSTDDIAVDVWTTPVSTTDYTANSQSDGGGTDLTSDIAVAVVKTANQMAVTLTNNGSTIAFITLLQARGTAIKADDSTRLEAQDSASQADHGKRLFSMGENFVPDVDEGQDWADFNLDVSKDPVPILSLKLTANVNEATHREVIARDISDRVTVVANQQGTGMGINEDFFIENISLERGEDQVLKATLLLSPASGYSNFWILGTSLLGTGTVLAY